MWIGQAMLGCGSNNPANAELRLEKAGPWIYLVKFSPIGLLIFAALTLAGCDKGTTATRPKIPAGSGVVRGVVRFTGKKLAPKIIGGDCCPGSTPVMDESLAVNDDGTMKNIVVYIKDGPNAALGDLKDRVLAQINCQYVPHVIAIQTGQNLVVTNHDSTAHNVLIQGDANPGQNFEELHAASRPVNFTQPELIRFKCAVHPWMTAYAYVFDHPFFAVTGVDGRFEIDRLPMGTYTLVAWQEKLEPQEIQLTVSSDKPAEVKFEFHGE